MGAGSTFDASARMGGWFAIFVRSYSGCWPSASDGAERGKGGLVGVGQRMQVRLRCSDAGMAESLLHNLEIGAPRQKPRCVGVSKIVHADAKLDLRRLESLGPDHGPEPVPRDMAVGVANPARLSRRVLAGVTATGALIAADNRT